MSYDHNYLIAVALRTSMIAQLPEEIAALNGCMMEYSLVNVQGFITTRP